MPAPMKYDRAIVLLGGTRGQSIGDMMRKKFAQAQNGRFGSLADRERGYLMDEGGKAGASRQDLWKKYLGITAANTRPWTDGFRVATSLARNAHIYKYPVNYVECGVMGSINPVAVRDRVLKYAPYSGVAEVNVTAADDLGLWSSWSASGSF